MISMLNLEVSRSSSSGHAQQAAKAHAHLEHHQHTGGIDQRCTEKIAAPDSSGPAQLSKTCQICMSKPSIKASCQHAVPFHAVHPDDSCMLMPACFSRQDIQWQ